MITLPPVPTPADLSGTATASLPAGDDTAMNTSAGAAPEGFASLLEQCTDAPAPVADSANAAVLPAPSPAGATAPGPVRAASASPADTSPGGAVSAAATVSPALASSGRPLRFHSGRVADDAASPEPSAGGESPDDAPRQAVSVDPAVASAVAVPLEIAAQAVSAAASVRGASGENDPAPVPTGSLAPDQEEKPVSDNLPPMSASSRFRQGDEVPAGARPPFPALSLTDPQAAPGVGTASPGGASASADDNAASPATAVSSGTAIPAVTAERAVAPVVARTAATASAAAEKIAATSGSPATARVQPAGREAADKFLDPDKQKDGRLFKELGIAHAKSGAEMSASPESTPSASIAPETRAPAESGVPSAQIQTPGASVRIALPTAAEAATREVAPPPASDAAGVVREVVELTHDFRARDRNSVEVKFNFKDQSELSVRLAYRDGDVHTTFRTDSEQLRATLSREWQGYAATVAQEPKGYRVADPVFTASGDFTGSPQGRDAGSAAGGDARQHSPSSHPDQPDSRRAGSAPGAFDPAPSEALAAHAARVPSDRLLHAFA